MSALTPDIAPIPRRAGDHAAVAVHAHLRTLILQGAFPPGAQLNQVELAPLLGVSRTPLREAIRMLQEEGLVEAQPQKRARIVGFDPDHLEAVYVQRMLLEGLAAKLTAPTFADDKLEELRGRLQEMRDSAAAGDRDRWHVTHKAFHRLLIGNVGPHLVRAITGHGDRSEHYRIMHVSRENPTGAPVPTPSTRRSSRRSRAATGTSRPRRSPRTSPARRCR
jgi:DNA-binding GntR family transcriptional regulator